MLAKVSSDAAAGDSSDSHENELASSFDEKEVLKQLQHFCNSSNMKQVKQDIALQKKIRKFRDTMERVLTVIDKFEHQNRTRLTFLFVMQSAEDYFPPSDTETKRTMCKELLLRFVDNNDSLCNDFMDAMQMAVKPSTMYRRAKKKCGRWVGFLWVI